MIIDYWEAGKIDELEKSHLLASLDPVAPSLHRTPGVDDRTHTGAQTQSIICGGGRKNLPKQYHLKIKAICSGFSQSLPL